MLEELEIIEMLTEERGSESEDIQSSIIAALSDEFDIVEHDLDSNILFRILSTNWFGSIIYFS